MSSEDEENSIMFDDEMEDEEVKAISSPSKQMKSKNEGEYLL
jgi:hypothetical protein